MTTETTVRVAAIAIAARIRAITPTDKQHSDDDLHAAIADAEELATDPRAFGTPDDALSVLNLSVERTADWTTDGCEDAIARNILDAASGDAA